MLDNNIWKGRDTKSDPVYDCCCLSVTYHLLAHKLLGKEVAVLARKALEEIYIGVARQLHIPVVTSSQVLVKVPCKAPRYLHTSGNVGAAATKDFSTFRRERPGAE